MIFGGEHGTGNDGSVGRDLTESNTCKRDYQCTDASSRESLSSGAPLANLSSRSGLGGNCRIGRRVGLCRQPQPGVKLDSSQLHGIGNPDCASAAAKPTKRRLVLAGDPSAKVIVRSVWGPGDGDSQTITIPACP